MKLDVQKRLAASVLKCSVKRVIFDSSKLKEIKEAITRSDVRGLVIDGFITRKNKKGVSSARSKEIKIQKSKGKRKGHGSRKGKRTARTPRKREWMNRVRLQRKTLSNLRDKKVITNELYWDLYRKIKGGFFRSKRHLQLFLSERIRGEESVKITEDKKEKETKEEKGKKPVKEANPKEKPEKKTKKETKK